MIKNYVLDTNVLLQDSEAMYKFEDNNIFIPYAVLDELDSLKDRKDNAEARYQARRAIRLLKEIQDKGCILTDMGWRYGKRADAADGNNHLKSYDLPGGGRLFFWSGIFYDGSNDNLAHIDREKHDNMIMAATADIERQPLFKDKVKTILVTSDVIMSIKAKEIFGIEAEGYKNQQLDIRYTGRSEYTVDQSFIDAIYRDGHISVIDAGIDTKLCLNEFVLLRSNLDEKKTALGYHAGNDTIMLIDSNREYMGIKPKNVGQQFAKEALLKGVDEAPLVILQGPAGTAKTFLAIAAGLHALEKGEVRQVLLLRPQSFFDEEIGFLPGTEQEKIDPLLRPFWDNLTYILTSSGENYENARRKIDDYIAEDLIRAESFAFLRGRSITDSFIIVDECQNTTRKQMKGVVTRAGFGSKLVLTGDIEQIDNPNVDKYNNGLTYLINAMKDSPLTWQVTFGMEECRRSELAKDAIKRLE